MSARNPGACRADVSATSGDDVRPYGCRDAWVLGQVRGHRPSVAGWGAARCLKDSGGVWPAASSPCWLWSSSRCSHPYRSCC